MTPQIITATGVEETPPVANGFQPTGVLDGGGGRAGLSVGCPEDEAYLLFTLPPIPRWHQEPELQAFPR